MIRSAAFRAAAVLALAAAFRPASAAEAGPEFRAFCLQSREIEDRADRALREGDFAAARRACAEWLRKDLSAAGTLDADAAPDAVELGAETRATLVRAGAALARLRRLARADGDDRPVLDALGAALESEPRFPRFCAKVRRHRMELLARAGRWDAALADRRALGFIDDWRVCGPCPAKDAIPEDAADPGVAAPQDRPPYTRWTHLAGLDPDGTLNLDRCVRPVPDSAARAFTELLNPTGRPLPAVLNVASDNGPTVLFNGAVVLSRDLVRPAAFDQDLVDRKSVV